MRLAGTLGAKLNVLYAVDTRRAFVDEVLRVLLVSSRHQEDRHPTQRNA